MKPPIPPPCRIIREGGCVGICDICGSSLKRRWFGLGKVIGCLQPKCWNWHGWSYLPAGSNRPIDLYGAPEKLPYAGVQPPKPWPRGVQRFSDEEVYSAFGLPTPRHYPPMPPVKAPRDTFEGPFGNVRSGTCSKCHRTAHVLSRQQGICPECFRNSPHVHEWRTADGEHWECASGAIKGDEKQ